MMSEWEFLDDFEDAGPLPTDTEIKSLQRACLANPDDMAPMLIYADYLADREYFRTERRVRLLVEQRLIGDNSLHLTPAMLAGSDQQDEYIDYQYAFNAKWLAHTPKYMTWKDRLIVTPPYQSFVGLIETGLKYAPRCVERIDVERRNAVVPPFPFSRFYTIYGIEIREHFTGFKGTIDFSLQFGDFSTWMKYRRLGELIDNQDITKFSITLKPEFLYNQDARTVTIIG